MELYFFFKQLIYLFLFFLIFERRYDQELYMGIILNELEIWFIRSF